jgi:cytochrome c oxidase cbb3-type subunit 3
MVGFSRREAGAISAWFDRLSLRARAIILVGLALLVILLVQGVLNGQEEARLIRAVPDDVPASPTLMRFATDHGRGIFATHCASCHGSEGLGRTSQGVPNLTDSDWLYGEGEASDIEQVVLYGIRTPNSRTWRLADMPAFARARPYSREPTMKPLTPGDISDVMQFLRLLGRQPADSTVAARGAAIYAGRGGCYDCHGNDGRGDPSVGAPNLTDAVWLYGDGSNKWLFDSIAYGRAGACPAWFNRLSPVQIREVALYVYALSRDGAQPKQSLP